MKKTILVSLTLLLAAISASAQLLVDVRAGATASSIKGQNVIMGVRGGASVYYLFSNCVGVRSGLFYTENGGTTSSDVLERGAASATRLMWLQLPLEITGRVRLSERCGLEPHGGFYFGRLLKSKVPSDAGYQANGWDAGIGVGVDFVAGRFVAGPEVQYGLAKVVSPSSCHNISYMFTLGYRF